MSCFSAFCFTILKYKHLLPSNTTLCCWVQVHQNHHRAHLYFKYNGNMQTLQHLHVANVANTMRKPQMVM